MRALVRNAATLAIDFAFLMDDESLSPWTLTDPLSTAAPHDLRPTSVQLCTPHHPYLDVMAPPAFRDNVLLACLDDDVGEQLCYEMHVGSFTVWGEQPWNAMGMDFSFHVLLFRFRGGVLMMCGLAWEVSQEFASSWFWLLDEGLIRTTNYWRGERGEAELVLPASGDVAVEELL